MNLRKNNSKATIIVDGRGDDRLTKMIAGTNTKASTSSTASTISTCASTVATRSSCASSTKASSTACTAPGAAATTISTTATSVIQRRSVAEIKAASKQDEFDDELESMLSLTQTLSFWDGEGDDDGDATYANSSYDNASYSGNTYDSSSTYYNDGRRGRGDRGFNNNRVASCGEGLEDTLETFVITGRAISSALKFGSKSMNSLFMGKLKQQLETKEKMKKLEEERKMKRDAQLREEMMTSRYEVSNVANLWREK